MSEQILIADDGKRPGADESAFCWGRRRIAIYVAAATLAVGVPLAYALITNQVWEDYFITFRYSRNLCEGRGLVYNPGERVHGFTSPVGCLLPAACYYLTGMDSYAAALWLFRGMSILAFAGGCLFLLRAFERTGAPPFAAAFMLVLYVGDAKGVSFTTNGMETGFMLFFLAGALYLSTFADAWLMGGMCWAGLMWTRPDGCVYIAALCIANLAFPAGDRRALLISLAKSAGVCAAAYLPWFAGAWVYYGSPIPNTVAAKAAYAAPYAVFVRGAIYYLKLNWLSKAGQVFGPAYWGFPQWMPAFSQGLTIICSLYWLAPVQDRLGRMASLMFLLFMIYTLFVPVAFPWYLPPIAMCGFVALSRGTFAIAERLRRLLPAAHVIGVGFLCLVAWVTISELALTTWEMKIDQAVLEEGNRKQIGLWLRDHARPANLVYLESLGYIGFFSDARVADYPGLVSPLVVHFHRDLGLDFFTLIPELKPDWLVIRPEQKKTIEEDFDYTRANYHRVRDFDVRSQLEDHAYRTASPWLRKLFQLLDAGPPRNPYSYMPGRQFLEHDAVFLVYERNRPALK